MKKYSIKYEDHSGDVHCVTVSAYSKVDAIYKIGSHREIYWIKLAMTVERMAKETGLSKGTIWWAAKLGIYI